MRLAAHTIFGDFCDAQCSRRGEIGMSGESRGLKVWNGAEAVVNMLGGMIYVEIVRAAL